MKIMTRDFGEVELQDGDVLELSQPLFGFEEYHKFALLQNEDVGEVMVWLQSVEEAAVCFFLFDPSGLANFYQPLLPENIDDLVGEGELECWVVGVVPGDFHETTVNLKSPIIVNRQTRRGAQIVLNQDYPVRYPLMKGGG